MGHGEMYARLARYIAGENEEAVSMERMALDVLVKRFSGYLPGAFEDAKWINHARQFRQEVESAKIMNLLNEYDFSFFTAAGYDGPMNIWNRRNEVMFHMR